MSSEHLLEDEDEDVILEGSDLHQALTDMGYTNFEPIPRAKMEPVSLEIDLSKNYESKNQCCNSKVNLIYEFVVEENKFKKELLAIISKADILLDDHAAVINDLFNEQQTSLCRKLLEWFPIIGSTITTTFHTWFVRKKSFVIAAITFVVFGFSTYRKFKCWIAARNLRRLVTLQNELHTLLKQGLKILRRTYGRKLIISEVHEKLELLGNEKSNIILSIKQLMTEIFKNLSHIYYQQASEILDALPDSLRLNCILTKIEDENEKVPDDKGYDELKSLYYSFILVQSELMFIMANACTGKSQNISFRIPKIILSQAVRNLIKPLTIYCSSMSKAIQSYQICEIQPVQRVFKGIPTSKWQDAYIHLDLTSQRIQLAYKEIASILESIDVHSEKDDNDQQLVESITERMNEAYKQIENARSFAEFSSLLIAKAQRKPINDTKEESKNENLFPINSDNRTVVMVDEDPEIEDEVFEEYIKEEYLKPLYENGDASTIENFKLDKLLAKHFMSELKEALIEKQRSMTERELKALKRMYHRVRRDSLINRIEPEKSTDNEKSTTPAVIPPLPPPLPPPLAPLLPPPTLINTLIAETEEDEEVTEQKKDRIVNTLPRVKMMQTDDDLPYVQRFSISECTPNFRFPPFKGTEETFLGSGENSEEEDDVKSDSDIDDGNEN